MNIPGIPESIPRKEYVAILEPLGLNLNDLVELHFRYAAVEAEVWALNAEGKRFLTTDDDGNEVVAKHHIIIPIKDDE